MDDDVRRFLRAREAELVDELTSWVRIPSVAGKPDELVEVVRSANWLAGALRDLGFPVVETWSLEEAPAVYAEWCEAPGAPTVLIYSHHDVRVTKDEQWQETDPFVAVVRDGYVYGRGASDAKGQVLAHLWGIRAHLAATGRDAPAVNLKLLVEGEEETGSAHLEGLLEAQRDRVSADLVVFSDTMLWRADHPAVCTSMRGTINAHLEVRGLRRDMHSGAVSGPAPSAVLALSRLLGSLYDDKGRITVPGFYDDVSEPTERRREELAALPFSEEDWLARSEALSLSGEVGYTVLEQLWTRPTVEVISMIAGDPIGLPRSVVPATASADLVIRTVPDQTYSAVAEQLRQWVAAKLDEDVTFELEIPEETAAPPYQSPEDHPYVLALAEAMGSGFGKPAGRMGNSGGGPADLLARLVDAPVIFFGTGLPEDRWHDSDERASIEVLQNGAATLAHLWEKLSSNASSSDRPHST